jgi:HSP20 family molecular chaperone IbpA
VKDIIVSAVTAVCSNTPITEKDAGSAIVASFGERRGVRSDVSLSRPLRRSVTWFESDGNTTIQADVNGDNSADFAVTLTGINLHLTVEGDRQIVLRNETWRSPTYRRYNLAICS